jgi:hypothetical protein
VKPAGAVQGRYDLLHRLIKAGPAGGRLRRPSSRRQRHDGHTGEPASPSSFAEKPEHTEAPAVISVQIDTPELQFDESNQTCYSSSENQEAATEFKWILVVFPGPDEPFNSKEYY